MAPRDAGRDVHPMEEHRPLRKPYYLPSGDEVEVFESAFRQHLPVLLKGPTGCGKTRFVEYMAWKIGHNDGRKRSLPLITVACHEDLTSSDLVGRFLLEGDHTRWIDGPLTKAVRHGAICYLDEIVEARKDTVVLIHPLADHRRILPIEKRGEVLEAADDFMLVLSYNPGYQSPLKDLKPSTRQRFVAIDFDYPDPKREATIVRSESGCDRELARRLAALAEKVRNLHDYGLAEGVSTRLLVNAAKLVVAGVSPSGACRSAVTAALTDDEDLRAAIDELVAQIVGP